jgi:ParB family chromosome partitioning protein
MDKAGLDDLTASVREHGVLQPILVRPQPNGHYQLIAGERRWRAAQGAGMAVIPALIEEIDDETALEIAVIENLQREDLSPMDEALIYDKMIREHGYSIRKLAQKLGKDKGYLENRLRLADAPQEVRDLVSLRKDTLSHAYELMKVDDPKKRKRLAGQVARGELSLVKLREKIEGRPARVAPEDEGPEAFAPGAEDLSEAAAPAAPTGDDALVQAKTQFHEALAGLIAVLRSQEFTTSVSPNDRQNLAKYLTISKLTLENVITVVRGPGHRE